MTTRQQILRKAQGQLESTEKQGYGEGGNGLPVVAQMWSAYLGRDIRPADVAAMMIMLKISRIQNSPEREDHWVDICGYAGLGAESIQEGI